MPFAELWSKSRACLALMAMLIFSELLALLIPVETENTSREGLSVASSFGMVFCGVVLGTYAAWVGNRFGRGVLRRVRAAHRIAATSLSLVAPALVIGASGYGLGWASIMYRAGEVFFPDLGLFLLCLLMILGLSLGGLGLGLLFGTRLSIVLSLVLFSGLQLLSLLVPGPMLSNMAGLFGCCTQDSGPNPAVIHSVVLCYLGWSMLGVFAICLRAQGAHRVARRGMAAAGVLSVVVLWGGGAIAAQNAGNEQELSRTSQLRCEQPGDGHQYCFWPNEAELWNDWGSNIVAGLGRLESATGIMQPEVVTSSKAHAQDTGGLRLDFQDRYSPETVVWDLALAMSVNPDEQCIDNLSGGSVSAGSALEDTPAQRHMWEQTNLLYEWWTTKADREFFDPQKSEEFDALLRLDEQAQISWVKDAAKGIEDCQLVALPKS